MKEWRAPIYGFFEPKPRIVEANGRRAHDFVCGARGCGSTIRRYLDKKDARSTGNLRKHAKSCWGVELVSTADKATDGTKVREALANGRLKDGSIKLAFEQTGKVTYLHRAHTRDETRYVTVAAYVLMHKHHNDFDCWRVCTAPRLSVGFLKASDRFQWSKTNIYKS